MLCPDVAVQFYGPDIGQWRMSEAAVEKPVEQFTEAESGEIYDLMIATGKIIQVTSKGVRVFYKVTRFSPEEILKARKVFPIIDRTDKLDDLLDRLYGRVKSDDDLKREIVETVYRPIKKEIDEILIDTRSFLVDSVAMAKVRTDLTSVLKSLDGLTLNTLNKVLTDDKSEFKRRIEFAVYSGLIASVIFGDYKTRRSQKKIVEDVILMAILHSVRDRAEEKEIFRNINKKQTTKEYDLDFILQEMLNVGKSQTNIISEILFVAKEYVEALNANDNEPILALTNLGGSIQQNTAIAVGALFTRYSIKDYRGRFKKMTEELKQLLETTEDKLRVQLARRMSEDTKIISKLGRFFLEDIAIKQAFKVGFQRVAALDQFHSVLEGIDSNCLNYIERLKGLEGEAYRELEAQTREAVDLIGIISERQSSVMQAADPTVPDEEIWTCILAENICREVDFLVGYVSGKLLMFGEECAKIYRMNQKLDLQRNFYAINESLRRLKPYLVEEKECLCDLARIAAIAARKLKAGPELRIIKGIPDGPINAIVEPLKVERMLSTLLENALEAVEARKQAQNEQDPGKSIVHYINLLMKQEEGICRIRVQDSGGGIAPETYDNIFVKRQPIGTMKKGTGLLQMQELLDKIDGASLNVDVKQGVGTTFEISLPVVETASPDTFPGDDIITALHKRHWDT